MALTNREMAEYFGKLDPDETAIITIVDGDGKMCETEALDLAGSMDLEDFEGSIPNPDMPIIYRKW